MYFLNFKYLILLFIISRPAAAVKFRRTIDAIGFPYYMLSFALGTCREHVLFSEYKAWPAVPMNRILDIYYKSAITVQTRNKQSIVQYRNTAVDFKTIYYLAIDLDNMVVTSQADIENTLPDTEVPILLEFEAAISDRHSGDYTVSSVEIKLILNNTDCLGYSKSNVGGSEFSATIYLATNMAFIFYSLTIYTCNQNITVFVNNEEGIDPSLPFYTNQTNHST